ncbi:MAG: FadR family transcriptional regulator [Lachnospiraceae bacterium]|nr:FadR family transcriptional regulator [Lachnospiraceae bacterium]
MKNDISLMTPISKDLLYMKIADAISNHIKKNDLKQGDKLPSERELAARFQTSRHSVREALRVLENQGIINCQMGSGTYVAKIQEESTIYLDLVKVNYIEMLNVKTELEKYAVSLVIERREEIGAEAFERLEGLLCQMERSGEQGIFEAGLDKEFHYLLSELSGNKMLEQMIKKMIEAFDEYYVVLPQSVKLCLDTICWHRVILDGIRQGDAGRTAYASEQMLLIDREIVSFCSEEAAGK